MKIFKRSCRRALWPLGNAVRYIKTVLISDNSALHIPKSDVLLSVIVPVMHSWGHSQSTHTSLAQHRHEIFQNTSTNYRQELFQIQTKDLQITDKSSSNYKHELFEVPTKSFQATTIRSSPSAPLPASVPSVHAWVLHQSEHKIFPTPTPLSNSLHAFHVLVFSQD